jgi:hypothetical protein
LGESPRVNPRMLEVNQPTGSLTLYGATFCQFSKLAFGIFCAKRVREKKLIRNKKESMLFISVDFG